MNDAPTPSDVRPTKDAPRNGTAANGVHRAKSVRYATEGGEEHYRLLAEVEHLKRELPPDAPPYFYVRVRFPDEERRRALQVMFAVGRILRSADSEHYDVSERALTFFDRLDVSYEIVERHEPRP